IGALGRLVRCGRVRSGRLSQAVATARTPMAGRRLTAGGGGGGGGEGHARLALGLRCGAPLGAACQGEPLVQGDRAAAGRAGKQRTRSHVGGHACRACSSPVDRVPALQHECGRPVGRPGHRRSRAKSRRQALRWQRRLGRPRFGWRRAVRLVRQAGPVRCCDDVRCCPFRCLAGPGRQSGPVVRARVDAPE
ncbi:hypothetical protein RZS08_10930, partial [Arthrospira platensis SPKY1]|nr:hypothetical protein [Arthrospira platensis SPKY1]